MDPIPPAATVAQFVTRNLKQPIREGNSFVAESIRFEVIDLDGQSVDKVLLTPLPKPGMMTKPAHVESVP